MTESHCHSIEEDIQGILRQGFRCPCRQCQQSPRNNRKNQGTASYGHDPVEIRPLIQRKSQHGFIHIKSDDRQGNHHNIKNQIYNSVLLCSQNRRIQRNKQEYNELGSDISQKNKQGVF